MASVQLKRSGYRVFYKTPKLIVNFQAPEGECLYDNCSNILGRRLNFSWEIKGRTACNGPIRTIQRLSASVINYTDNTDVSQFTVEAIQGLPLIANPSRSKTYFGGLPQNGISTRTQLSPDTLQDECFVTHGGDTDEIYERFLYTEDCVYKPAFQYSVSHAADASLTAAQLGANITAMGGTFLTAIAPTVACETINAQLEALWGALATSPITLALGAYE